MIDENQKSWLVGVPTSDSNFKWHLKYANDETVEAALAAVREKPEGNKTKIKTLEARLRFLRRWRKQFEKSKAAAKAALNIR